MDISGANIDKPLSRQLSSIKIGVLNFYNLQQGKKII